MPTMNKTGNVEEGHPTEHRASSAGEVMRWRVPIDDTHTMHFTVEFGAMVEGKPAAKIMKDDSGGGGGGRQGWPGWCLPGGRVHRLVRKRRSRSPRTRKPGVDLGPNYRAFGLHRS